MVFDRVYHDSIEIARFPVRTFQLQIMLDSCGHARGCHTIHERTGLKPGHNPRYGVCVQETKNCANHRVATGSRKERRFSASAPRLERHASPPVSASPSPRTLRLKGEDAGTLVGALGGASGAVRSI